MIDTWTYSARRDFTTKFRFFNQIYSNLFSIREFFRNEILEAIPDIRKKNKRPDSKAIFSYIARNSATNVGESFIDKMLNELFAEKIIVNSPKSCGDSFFVVENCLAEKEKYL